MVSYAASRLWCKRLGPSLPVVTEAGAYDPILYAVFNWEAWRVDRDAHSTQNFARFGFSPPHRIAPSRLSLTGSTDTESCLRCTKSVRPPAMVLPRRRATLGGNRGAQTLMPPSKKGTQDQSGCTPRFARGGRQVGSQRHEVGDAEISSCLYIRFTRLRWPVVRK